MGHARELRAHTASSFPQASGIPRHPVLFPVAPQREQITVCLVELAKPLYCVVDPYLDTGSSIIYEYQPHSGVLETFLGVLSKAFCALHSFHSGGGGSLYLLFGATGCSYLL